VAALPHGQASITRSQQEVELKAIRAELELPGYAAIHSHVLQDVLARLDTTYQAFYRRVQRGEKPGFPRLHGKHRSHSFTDKEYGNGARLDNGSPMLAKIGRVAVRWSRTMQGTIKTKTVPISREADGQYVSFSCAEVPMKPLPRTGKRTGGDVGLKGFLITAEGQAVENPRYNRTAEHELEKAQQRVSRRTKGSSRRRTAVQVLARTQQHVRRQRSDLHHKTARAPHFAEVLQYRPSAEAG
jgi:putative transposase